MPRKTVDVKTMVTNANAMLRSEKVSDEYRLGVIRMIEDILHLTNTYAGFTYVKWWDLGGVQEWRAAGEPEDKSPYIGNETQRIYFHHNSL